jgi:hypothetical protein
MSQDMFASYPDLDLLLSGPGLTAPDTSQYYSSATPSIRTLDALPVFPPGGFIDVGGVMAAARSADPGLRAAALLRIDQFTGDAAISDAFVADLSREYLKIDPDTAASIWSNPMTIMEGYDWDGDVIWRYTTDYDIYGPNANHAYPPMTWEDILLLVPGSAIVPQTDDQKVMAFLTAGLQPPSPPNNPAPPPPVQPPEGLPIGQDPGHQPPPPPSEPPYDGGWPSFPSQPGFPDFHIP